MPDEPLWLGAPLQLWHELVREGERRTHVPLPEGVESYLVFVLQRHQRDAWLGARIMALECLHGLECAGRERADTMRDVGDRCLLIAGLFPQLARRRNVTPGYYAALGQAAYESVAGVTRAGQAELFVELARRFGAMLRVLGALRACGACATAPQPAATPHDAVAAIAAHLH